MASNYPNGVREEVITHVAVRCRPGHATMGNTWPANRIVWNALSKKVGVKTQGNEEEPQQWYKFDEVFPASATQNDVYYSLAFPILGDVLRGFKCTIIAYGPMGTGKTHTMMGEGRPDAGRRKCQAGIIPRFIHHIFERLAGTDFSVKVSLLEIYNEELFDLLREDVPEQPRHSQLCVDAQYGTSGLREVTLRDPDEAYPILERGFARRKTAHTPINARSSRSHVMVSVTIQRGDRNWQTVTGTLHLVDLASSEDFKHYRVPDERAQEAEYIHQSLLALGRVITALSEKRPHVPYRDSILTRVLQDSLGGSTKTTIIATVPQFFSDLEEMWVFLGCASKARSIMFATNQRRIGLQDTQQSPYRRLL